MMWNEERAEDVAAASAAYAWNVIEAIAALPPAEGYRRLCDLFRTTILAYCECGEGWGTRPAPSDN